MKRNSDPRHAAASSSRDDESPRRPPHVATHVGAKGRPASQRPVTVQLPDLTPPVDDEDSSLDEAIADEAYEEQDCDREELDREELAPEVDLYAQRRAVGAARHAAQAKTNPATRSALPAKPPAKPVPKPSPPEQRTARPETRTNRDPNRKPVASAAARQENGRRVRPGDRATVRGTEGAPERSGERTGDRRRREASESKAGKKPAKAKVGAGPLLIGMGLVGLILAGYAAIQKNSQQSADSGDNPGSGWQAKVEGDFTAPKVDLPGEAMSPEEFAARSTPSQPGASQPSSNPWEDGDWESSDRSNDALAENERWASESEIEFDNDSRYASSGGDARNGSAKPDRSYEPGSTVNDAPLVVYGRRGERAGAATEDSIPSEDNPYGEASVADARGAAYPSTDPANYRLPAGQSAPESYRVGRRETYETGDNRYGDAAAASGGRTQTDRFVRPQSYDAPGTRGADPREYDPRAIDPRASDPRTGGYREYDSRDYDGGGLDQSASPHSRDQSAMERAPAYDGSYRETQADEEQFPGDSPAYESANRPSAESASSGARLQGGVQPSYNGSRYERPGSRLY